MLIGDVSGIPDEIAQVTGWFPDGRAGGPTGAELPSLMLQSIGDTLAVGRPVVPADRHHPGREVHHRAPRT